MSTKSQVVSTQQALRSMFHRGVSAVQPKQLFAPATKCFEYISDQDVLIVTDGNHKQTIPMSGKSCHLVGFGKAVLGMAVQIEQLLSDRLVSGVLSVPVGTLDKFADNPDMKLRSGSCIEVYEGAKDNLPDELAAQAAKLILRKCEQMSENDVLIVLISGGGSALIPLPIDPVTVAEKRDLVRSLANRQATINELNTVRIAISNTKGGKLGRAARNAFRCVSLVISDVCGDPLDIIASGPTFKTNSAPENALGLIKKYNLYDSLPESIRTILLNINSTVCPTISENVSIFVIGNNQLACVSALAEAQSLGLFPVIISTEMIGNVKTLSECYAKLFQTVYKLRNEQIGSDEWDEILNELTQKMNLKPHVRNTLFSIITDRIKGSSVCLIAGGEPTVEIRGNGLGGRNQELALRLSVLLKDDPQLENIMFLSAGTDGIDGPTSAAGAVACSRVCDDARQSELNLSSFLENNDSFNFYKQLNGGEYHVVTGHTGTNVMDLHICVLPF